MATNAKIPIMLAPGCDDADDAEMQRILKSKPFADKCRFRRYKNKHGFVLRGELADIADEYQDVQLLLAEFLAGVFAQ